MTVGSGSTLKMVAPSQLGSMTKGVIPFDARVICSKPMCAAASGTDLAGRDHAADMKLTKAMVV